MHDRRTTAVPGWIILNALALGSALAHTFIDQHLGFSGQVSSSMSLVQALNIGLTCLIVGWWTVSCAAASAAGRPGLSAAFVLALGWTFAGNGLVILLAPPPSDAFPYQDLAHFGSLIFGVWAAIATRREMRRTGTAWSAPWIAATIVVLIALFVAQGLTSGTSRT